MSLVTTDAATFLSVTDTGAGILPKDLSHVFEPFYRGANAVPGGSGLGLPLVKEIVRLHGGRVHLASSGTEGTKISIEFPK